MSDVKYKFRSELKAENAKAVDTISELKSLLEVSKGQMTTALTANQVLRGEKKVLQAQVQQLLAEVQSLKDQLVVNPKVVEVDLVRDTALPDLSRGGREHGKAPAKRRPVKKRATSVERIEPTPSRKRAVAKKKAPVKRTPKKK